LIPITQQQVMTLFMLVMTRLSSEKHHQFPMKTKNHQFGHVSHNVVAMTHVYGVQALIF